MERNVESHFSDLPDLAISRSRFDMSCGHKTTFDVGELIPIACFEIIPGDTFEVKTSAVVRLQTLLTPIFDNIYLDTYWFFTPNRIVWDHWKEFMGENGNSPWIPSTTYQLPRTIPPSDGWSKGTIADYLGIPIGVYNNLMPPQSLPFRDYALICREWFTDQNLSYPVVVSTGDAATQGTNGNNYITDTECGGYPFKVAKYHDYFTSCLPYVQKSADIGLFANKVGPYASSIDNHYVPVIARGVDVSDVNNTYLKGKSDSFSSRPFSSNSSNGNVYLHSIDSTYEGIIPQNLWADLGYADLTINTLRLAFQMQKFFEKSALYGTRYREVIKSHFGVTTSDGRMQVPEYLGGHRFPLSIHQIANQAQTSDEFLGDVGALSVTSDVHEDFIKSFEEHGYLMCVCCARYDHSYPQGMEKMWLRYNMLDFYFPVFANLSNMPVYKTEIDWQPGQIGTEVFGYQEAWADYRYKPNRVSGEFRPGYSWSLSSWHLADYYTSVPSLSDGWIREDKSNVDRVLAVSSEVSNQILGDFWFDVKATRPMPIYSIPGLIDHH